MSRQSAFHDPFRPVASQVKWWIVGAVFLILGAWEFAHPRFARVPASG